MVDDEKVEDRADTYLVWQNDLEVGSATKTWEEAIGYCEDLDLESIDDWRLPNIKELTTVINDAVSSPSIYTPTFEHTANDNYWSSTTASNSGDAWSVNFEHGTHEILGKTTPKYVRCVSRGSK